MKVLFADDVICDPATIKRLLLLADEVGFADRPSVSFGLWAISGKQSPAPTLEIAEIPVRVSKHSPPSGIAEDLYSAFISADLGNAMFVKAMLEGLGRDADFARMFLHPDANYGAAIDAGDYNGSDIVAALTRDKKILSERMTESPPIGFEHMFGIATHKQRVNAFKYLLIDASIKVSSAWTVSQDADLVPISSNASFARLLSIRASCSGYEGVAPYAAPWLGMSILRSVIPDEMLEHFDVSDVLEYRLATVDIYRAWSIEIDRLATRLEGVPADRLEHQVINILKSEVAPKIQLYRQELISARDEFVGDLAKTIARWEFPTIALAFVAPVSATAGLAAVAAAFAPAIPNVVDYFLKRRELGRNNAFAYLLGLSNG